MDFTDYRIDGTLSALSSILQSLKLIRTNMEETSVSEPINELINKSGIPFDIAMEDKSVDIIEEVLSKARSELALKSLSLENSLFLSSVGFDFDKYNFGEKFTLKISDNTILKFDCRNSWSNFFVYTAELDIITSYGKAVYSLSENISCLSFLYVISKIIKKAQFMDKKHRASLLNKRLMTLNEEMGISFRLRINDYCDNSNSTNYKIDNICATKMIGTSTITRFYYPYKAVKTTINDIREEFKKDIERITKGDSTNE